MLTVLLVDDNAGIRDLNAKILEKLDCEVIQMGDATKALSLLEDGNQFDVIFVDYRMPYINGIELFERIKSMHPHASVVLTSVSPNIETQALIEINGLKDCVLGYADRARFKLALDRATGSSAAK